MGAYKRDAVVVIQLGAYIHRVLTFYGCLLPRFYSISIYVHTDAIKLLRCQLCVGVKVWE